MATELPPRPRTWIVAVVVLSGLCILLAVIAFVGSVDFTHSPSRAWRSWPFQPLVQAALWPIPFLALLSLVLLLRGLPRSGRIAVLVTAVILTAASLTPAFVEMHARLAIRPTLMREAGRVAAPEGVLASGRPHLSLLTYGTDDDGPGGPQATWFWPLAPGQTSACAAVRSMYEHRPGWSFDSVSCWAISREHRVVILLRPYDEADLTGYAKGMPGSPAVPGVKLVVTPDDGSPPF